MSQFDYQEVSNSKLVPCSNNDVRVGSIFDMTLFKPMTTKQGSYCSKRSYFRNSSISLKGGLSYQNSTLVCYFACQETSRPTESFYEYKLTYNVKSAAAKGATTSSLRRGLPSSHDFVFQAV